MAHTGAYLDDSPWKISTRHEHSCKDNLHSFFVRPAGRFSAPRVPTPQSLDAPGENKLEEDLVGKDLRTSTNRKFCRSMDRSMMALDCTRGKTKQKAKKTVERRWTRLLRSSCSVFADTRFLLEETPPAGPVARHLMYYSLVFFIGDISPKRKTKN